MATNDSSDPAYSGSPSPAISFARVLKAVVPIVIALVAGAWAAQTYLPGAAQRTLESNQLDQLLGSKQSTPSTSIEFVDSNGDLLCDTPPAEQCQTPAKLVFAYVASEEVGDEQATWQPLLDAVAEATGIPTEFTHFTRVEEQLAAMVDGELHVAAFNTGAVPTAVRHGGFIPVSTFGKDGDFGYTMNIVVQADSPYQKVSDLRGRKITFVRPNSNSGFKAAFVHLINEHNMLPERDYQYGFSMGHDTSAQEVAAGKTDAAPVASDLLERMVAAGELDASKLRVIYQSERFPPVALGHVYNLKPELQQSIAELLTEFKWEGTPLVDAYGADDVTGFVPVNYKDDWANIRRIDDALDEARTDAN